MSSKAACSSGYRIEVDCFEVLEIPVGTVRVGEKWYSSCTPELINQKRQDVQGVLLFEIFILFVCVVSSGYLCVRRRERNRHTYLTLKV